jgi:hypothetical protein
VIDWKRVPWTLWLLAVLFLGNLAILICGAELRAGLVVFSGLFVVGWLYLLFSGNRWVWILTIALFVVSLVIDLANGSPLPWYSWVINLAELALLVKPDSCRFFAQRTTLA